jgi:hypothetical protein
VETFAGWIDDQAARDTSLQICGWLPNYAQLTKHNRKQAS